MTQPYNRSFRGYGGGIDAGRHDITRTLGAFKSRRSRSPRTTHKPKRWSLVMSRPSFGGVVASPDASVGGPREIRRPGPSINPGGSGRFQISRRCKLPQMDPRLRELIALSALAALACGLAATQNDLLFVAIFGAASLISIVEAIRCW